MTDRLVEVYRGFEIERTAEVMGFPVRAAHAFCFVSGYRREDDAPCLATWPSVEICRREIDDMIEDAAAPRLTSADLEAARDRHALQQHSNINHEAA